jgi:acyl-coenzyme A thioesterase PaaI-like protein
MTDVLGDAVSVPSRLGVTAELIDGELVMKLRPRPEVLRFGVVRVSVVAFMVDVAAGVVLDDDPSAWTLTTDMSVRMRPLPAPEGLRTRSTILRRGRRSSAAMVDLDSDLDEPVASGAIGFARLPRRETDPIKPVVSLERITASFNGLSVLSQPLREEAGIVVLDARQGMVEVPLTWELRNPAGTLQGAMVALVAEVAAEELMSTRFGIDAVVVDLDLRYLAQTGAGPVRSRCTLLGDDPESPIKIELFDTSDDRLTTLVYARTVAIRP